MFFVKTDHLPSVLTSYDLLKSLAVILMVVDHVGYYIDPDNQWWRAVATSAPFWFFFVGYASGRNLNPPIWIGAGIIMAGDMIFGGNIFPLNILFAIIFVRIILDPLMRFTTHNAANGWLVGVMMVILLLPSWFFFEYGTAGIVIAMAAWLLRHKGEAAIIDKIRPFYWGLAALMLYFATLVLFGFSSVQMNVFGVSMMTAFALCYFFEVKNYPDLTAKLPNIVVSALKIMGRYSLYLYVVHVVLFMIIAQWTNAENFGLLQWGWM